MTSVMMTNRTQQHLNTSKKSSSSSSTTTIIDDNNEQETAVPDSTTAIEKEQQQQQKSVLFTLGQDVLLKHKDGRYYLGTVVEVDAIREQCLVRFGDNTENWSDFKDLAKLNTPEKEDLCVVCKKSAPKTKNEITVCDKCGRGYHRRCHQPEIPINCEKEGVTWMCRRCTESEPHRLKKTLEYKHLRKEPIKNLDNNTNNSTVVSSGTKPLPYDPEALNWDAYHRVNMENVYCYCGRDGEWFTQMLQCGRCRQWFHEKCVSCLRYPLYCGDRFYVFVCSICNHGKEFIRRLELKWVDLVHLMIFNLTAFNSKKYYDLDTVIIPYINDNWHALQLPPKISSVSKSERRDNILSVLTNNRNRFKCGREIKKRTTIWGLRVPLPPPAPCVSLPPIGPISESELRERWQGNRRLQFLPEPETRNGAANNKMIVPLDSQMLSIMMGTAYLENSAQSETESPCPSPEVEQEEPPVYKVEFPTTNCVKKTVPFPKINLKNRKRLLSLNVLEREQLKHKRKLDSGKNNKRLSLDSNKTGKTSESLPPTPPTSVSAPPTPPAVELTTITELGQKLNNALLQPNNNKTSSNSSRNNLLLTGLETSSVAELNTTTPCDTSGDETSSKSTLDLIIPPPKDFEGKNNPFLALLRGSIVEEQGSKKKRRKDAITLPLPLTAVIPGRPIGRPMKRQLSEKDICIGPNGEVKRRRFRRSRINQLTALNYGQPTASKTATVVPVRPDAKEWGQRSLRSSLNQAATTPTTTPTTTNNSQIGNCVDYALNGRRLRQRHDKNVEKEKASSNPPTPKPSPVKQEPDISIDDLKSSVNSYFGAANRITAGERFTMKAKRIGVTGKVECLIEWEGAAGGMT